MNFIGNQEIIKQQQHKTAFLCSRRVPADIILKSYDWAIEQREKGRCIISGFHSQIEKDVFHYLVKGSQPIIMVLEKYFKKRYPPFDKEIKQALKDNRLLIITQFDEKVKRGTSLTAQKRNELMCKMADEIFIGYASKGGSIEKLLSIIGTDNKPISRFNNYKD